MLERAKLVVEPSGAAGLATLMAGRTEARGKTAVPLCGGNRDALALADLTQREMLRADRYLRLLTACDDRPGALAGLLDVVAGEPASSRSTTTASVRTAAWVLRGWNCSWKCGTGRTRTASSPLCGSGTTRPNGWISWLPSPQ